MKNLLLLACAVFAACAAVGFPMTNYTFRAADCGVGVLAPAHADDPRMFLLLCEPNVTAQTLEAAKAAAAVSNWWHVVYCTDALTGDATHDLKRLGDIYEAGIAHGFSPYVFKTAAVTPAGKALERRFLAQPRRPKPERRTFRSAAVDAKVAEVSASLRAKGEERLAVLFENCFPNTLDTTVRCGVCDGKPDTFVITGDIEAMWLRDSAAQVWPYLAFARDDEPLRQMIRGVLRRQFASILLDPYANAFSEKPVPSPHHLNDDTEMRPGVYERKYELDSLCYPLRLAAGYARATGDRGVYDARFRRALRVILNTMREQQRKADGLHTAYRFQRLAKVNNAVENGGYGRRVRPCGLIASAFRPSDDATILPFLVPSNFMAVDVLEKTASELTALGGAEHAALAAECAVLAAEVKAALYAHAVVEHPVYGRILAYEVDGFGSHVLMDDANVPSLLALPYFTDMPKDDPIYLNTRRYVLSGDNPYYSRGKALTGVGGPHTGDGMVWPMSVILRGLTTDDRSEREVCLRLLAETDAGTGFMHEAVDKDNPSNFTRCWFAWANTLFGELVLRRESKLTRP